MRIRSASLVAASVLVANAIVVAVAGPAVAGSGITYGGRAVALSGSISGTGLGFADSLPLAPTGGVQSAELLTAGVSGTLAGDSLHSSVVGQGDRTRSESSIGSLTLTVGSDTITADFARTEAMAVSTNGAPDLSGSAEVSSLVVNGTPVVATGQANQTVALSDGQLVIGEQQVSTSGGLSTITVSALHLVVSGTADVLVASSSASLASGSSNCSSNFIPATGGGWILTPGKGTFGFTAKPVDPIPSGSGHVVFVDHATGTKIEGPVTTYTAGGNTATFQGPAEVNGQPSGNFTVSVQDNGKGTTDFFSISTDGVPPQNFAGTLQGGNIQIHKPCK